MALTAEVRLVDADGRTGKIGLVFASGVTTIALAQTAFAAWKPLFEAISGMGVRGANLTAPLTLTPSAAKTGANKDEGVWFTMTDTNGHQFSVRVPAPAETAGVWDYIVNGQVDTANADVIDFVEQYESGGSIRFGAYSSRISAGLDSGYLEK